MSSRPSEIPARLASYFELIRQRQDLFDNSGGGLKILLDPVDILAVEHFAARDLIEHGHSPMGATAGCVLDDPWFVVLRDAVEFPDGSRRLHARVVIKKNHGSAILPLLNGRVILIRHYRHAIRQWMLEIPRGALEAGQTPEQAAVAEIREEIGGEMASLRQMGFVHGATNVYSGGAHLFLGELVSIGQPQLSEGITAIEELTLQEFEACIRDGKILDSLTLAAFAHARLRGWV